jgi:hypothetical protein
VSGNDLSNKNLKLRMKLWEAVHVTKDVHRCLMLCTFYQVHAPSIQILLHECTSQLLWFTFLQALSQNWQYFASGTYPYFTLWSLSQNWQYFTRGTYPYFTLSSLLSFHLRKTPMFPRIQHVYFSDFHTRVTYPDRFDVNVVFICSSFINYSLGI